jgi:hypothetical protein
MTKETTRQLSPVGRIFAGLTMLIVWSALIIQVIIALPVFIAQGFSTFGALVQTFCFFTMTTNTLVAIYLAVVVFAPSSRYGQFFLRASVTAAVAKYIIFVSIIHTLLLRVNENPEGWHWVTNNTLHLLVPVLFVIYWLGFAPPERIPYRATVLCLIYPVTYFAFTLIRGALLGTYPYPFIDVNLHGYTTVIITATILTLIFWLFSLAIVWINRLLVPPSKSIEAS